MMTITVAKEEKRQFARFESDGYRVEVTQDVLNASEIEKTIEDTFAIIRKQITFQKETDKKDASAAGGGYA